MTSPSLPVPGATPGRVTGFLGSHAVLLAGYLVLRRRDA